MARSHGETEDGSIQVWVAASVQHKQQQAGNNLEVGHGSNLSPQNNSKLRKYHINLVFGIVCSR